MSRRAQTAEVREAAGRSPDGVGAGRRVDMANGPEEGMASGLEEGMASVRAAAAGCIRSHPAAEEGLPNGPGEAVL